MRLCVGHVLLLIFIIHIYKQHSMVFKIEMLWQPTRLSPTEFTHFFVVTVNSRQLTHALLASPLRPSHANLAVFSRGLLERLSLSAFLSPLLFSHTREVRCLYSCRTRRENGSAKASACTYRTLRPHLARWVKNHTYLHFILTRFTVCFFFFFI